VRVSGLVVGIDEYATKHIYTLDDGSGVMIKVVYALPRPTNGQTATEASSMASNLDGPVDIGHVLDVKGIVRTFRDERNIHADKIKHLRCTEEEVAFWEKTSRLKAEVLSQPWVLDPRVVRKLRKKQEDKVSPRRHRDSHRRERRKADQEEDVVKDRDGTRLPLIPGNENKVLVTGLERRGPMLKEVAKGPPEKPAVLTGLEKSTRRAPSPEKRAVVTGLERSTNVSVTEEMPVLVTGLERAGRAPVPKKPVPMTGLEKKKKPKPHVRLVPVGEDDVLDF